MHRLAGADVTPPIALLIVVAGPARGRSVPLAGMLSIGRDEQNALPISDPALSRNHCAIEGDGAQFVLKDLASKNGVFVNGVPITERVLTDGDQIRIGDSALVVMIPQGRIPTKSSGSAMGLDDTPVLSTSTLAVETARKRYFDPDQNLKRSVERAAGDLGLLLRLSAALQRVTSGHALYDVLLTHALDAVPADGAAVLAKRTGAEELALVVAKAAGDLPVTINRVIATRAIADRVAVLANDVSALCVPLAESDSESVVLCLTNNHRKRPFNEDELQLFAAIGSISGLALDRIRHLEWLSSENTRLRQDVAIHHNLVGESPQMQAVSRFIARAAPTDATVLLYGESGTGKELVARAIHANSARTDGPFVAINCAALPEALLESELFGHERGAFTGAISQQRGRLEMADRGTVFLDEVGELASSLQAKLLRVLQDQIVERVGARRGIKIDVRVIAATNRDLEVAMTEGTFRKDLFYRLNVVSLTISPLRERRGDLPLLAAYFLRKHAAACKRPVKGIAPAARSLIARYDWPGNIRELSNAIERAVVLGSSDVILPEDLPESLLESRDAESAPEGFHALVAVNKREIIGEALERHRGNVAAAARDLGLQPTYLHRLIRNLGVRSTGAEPTSR